MPLYSLLSPLAHNGLPKNQALGKAARASASGWLAGFGLVLVLLFAGSAAEARPDNNCFRGKQCGNTCIAEWKTCRIEPPAAPPAAAVPAPSPAPGPVRSEEEVRSEPVLSSRHLMPESAYQKELCASLHGKEEFVLDDLTRVDCLTSDLAIEVEFAEKWAESVGQSLHYARKTGRTPTVALILESRGDLKYLDHLIQLNRHYRLNLKIKKIMRPEVAELLREASAPVAIP